MRSTAVALGCALALLPGTALAAPELASRSAVDGRAAGGVRPIHDVSDTGLVVFSTPADHVVTGDEDFDEDVFVRDLARGTTRIVSTSAQGGDIGGGAAEARISADGRFVAFSSTADNIVADDTNGLSDVFVLDLGQPGARTERVSFAPDGEQWPTRSGSPSISGDGRYVAYTHVNAVHVYDRETRSTELVTRVDGEVTELELSADGRHVAFVADASDLGDARGIPLVYAGDLDDGRTEIVSRADGPDGAPTSAASGGAAISGDGRYVAFATSAPEIAAEPGDRNPRDDVAVRDRATGRTNLVTADPAADAGGSPSISADGRLVAFERHPQDATQFGAVHVRDMATGALQVIEPDAPAPSRGARLADGGAFVTVQAWTDQWYAGETRGTAGDDVFRAAVTLPGAGPGQPAAPGATGAPGGSAPAGVDAVPGVAGAPGTSGPAAVATGARLLTARRVRLRAGRIAITVAGGRRAPLSGVLTVRAGRRVVARRRVAVARGRPRRLALRLSAWAARAVRVRGTLRVRAVLRFRDAAGTPGVVARTVTVRRR